MSVAQLFISHQHMASHVLSRAESLHAERLANSALIEAPLDTAVDNSPDTIVHALANRLCALLVSGLTLPKLMRHSSHRDEALPGLPDKAISGGQQDVMLHASEED